MFAAPGYAAVTVDFHGSTGYGQAFTDAINRDWGGAPLEDLRLGLAAAGREDPALDTANACALGGSYGGFMANWIAGNWPDGFKCLVSHSGVFDQRAMAYETEELWFTEWEFGGPYFEPAAAANYERWNPVRFVQNFRTPMLVIHGERDYRIPYSQSLGLFNALQRRNIPSRLVVFPDENHWILKPQNSIQWYREVHGWLDQWLRGAGPQHRNDGRATDGEAGGAADGSPLIAAAMTELPKTFDPAEIEARWYRHWEEQGLFRPERREAEPWTIVMPPPNVTGSLHIGHALDITLQDILTRHARLKGKDALWVVGTDHAGIATQMVVERQLDEPAAEAHRLQPRRVRRARSGNGRPRAAARSPRQLRRLGASCDWANERFTMDPGFSARGDQGVRPALPRGPALPRQAAGQLGPEVPDRHLRPRGRDDRGAGQVLALPLSARRRFGVMSRSRRRGPRRCSPTWRSRCIPTTSATARWSAGRCACRSPAALVPIIADEHADPELGLGRGQDHAGPRLQRFRGRQARRHSSRPTCSTCSMPQARVVQTADGLIPDELLGLDRFEARKRVVAMIEAEGALEKVEDRDRSRRLMATARACVIEPWLTDQWYVDAATLAKPAIEAVRSGDIKVVPKTWEKTWFNWLENIQPWCVSRQLWWGHQIPAWYDDEGNVYVAETEAEAQAQAGEGVAAAPRSRRARHLVLLGAVAVRDAGLARADRDAAPPLSQRRADLGLRHHLLLGRPDGDAGLPLHGREAVEDALSPRPGPRRQGPEDVQVEGQYGRSARPDRPLRRRRAALHPGGDGKPGPRHQAR